MVLEHVRGEVLRRIVEFKNFLVGQPDFEQNERLRALYVWLLAAEGAAIFGHEVELGNWCLEFCRKKEREVTEGN